MKLIFIFNIIYLILVEKLNNVLGGIPIGVLVHINDLNETRPMIERLNDYINSGGEAETKWTFQLYVLKTYDESELLNAVCNQMSRGVLAIFGETNMFTAESIKSFVNHYNIPFFTWTYPTSDLIPNDSKEEAFLLDEENDYDDDEETQKIKMKNKTPQTSYLFNMYPSLTGLLISLLKYHKWKNIYYIYDNDEALIRIQAMLDYQTRDNDYVTNINCK